MLRTILILSFVLLVAIIVYFSSLSDPDLSHTGLLPDWLAGWADRHGNFRTSVPYFFLGIIYEILMRGRNNNWKKRLAFWSALFVLVVITEIIQLYLPSRYPSFADIFWGSTGTAAGMLAGGFVNFVFTPEGE